VRIAARTCFALCLLALLSSCVENPNSPADFTYRVINEYPHDAAAFTQGLVFENGVLYEGTGIRGQSSLRRVDLETGNVLQQHNLAANYFGEGITILGDRIFQLTWQSHKGFVYALDTFEALGEFSYPTEGWGLTHNGVHLILSDGSSTIYFLDPDNFEEVRRIQVVDSHGFVTRLNELEYIDGEIYANVWQTDRIVRIAPDTGQVASSIDLDGLLSAQKQSHQPDVLNGIAYDAEGDRLFVTGKWWPTLFEIELVPVSR
jgi:glutaminyl-peptide cyclotransferase